MHVTRFSIFEMNAVETSVAGIYEAQYFHKVELFLRRCIYIFMTASCISFAIPYYCEIHLYNDAIKFMAFLNDDKSFLIQISVKRQKNLCYSR